MNNATRSSPRSALPSAATAGPASSTTSRRAARQDFSEGELADGVATARVVRDEAIVLLAPRVDELLGRSNVAVEAASAATSRAHTLGALGASVGANSHALVARYIAGALELGLSARESRRRV